MRLGLVTDIHNHAAELARALAIFDAHEVDQVVTLGDTCDAFGPGGAAEVAALLHARGTAGVWGNHDFSLCRNVSERHRARYGQAVLDFMAGMQPWLEIDGCRFSHKEATTDPYSVEQLWAVTDGPLDLWGKAVQSFSAVTHARQFLGHYHRWWAATPDGPLAWDGKAPLELASGRRYFVVVAAVFDGWCGVFDTESGLLRPMRCRDG